MQVTLNGEQADIPECTVQQLLAARQLERQPCAVEVNRRLVPKAAHGERRLAEGDVIEIVTLVGGG
jgi:thiamine biosynthesis protein ThiS